MGIAEKLQTVAENEQKVYDAGVQAEYDKFWDTYQNYGKKTDYTYTTFMYWSEKIFKPKYDIKPVGTANSLFRNMTGITDLDACLKECGVTLDLSKVTNFNDAFGQSSIEYIDELNLSSCSNATFLFATSKIKRIEKFITKTDGSINLNYGFINAWNLEHIIFEGLIGKSIDFSSCAKLDYESLINIISVLKDYSGTGTTPTLTLGETNLAKLTDEEKATATNKDWTLA